MPLQLAVAVELDRLGNSQLLEVLSTLGFCVSYDEVVTGEVQTICTAVCAWLC